MDTSAYWLETLRLWREVPLKCRNGHYFFEISNLGQWRCTQHAAEYSRDEARWPCCGKWLYSPGCVRADHNTGDFNFGEVHTIELPAGEKIETQVPAGPGVDGLVIRRFDVEAHRSKTAD